MVNFICPYCAGPVLLSIRVHDSGVSCTLVRTGGHHLPERILLILWRDTLITDTTFADLVNRLLANADGVREHIVKLGRAYGVIV